MGYPAFAISASNGAEGVLILGLDRKIPINRQNSSNFSDRLLAISVRQLPTLKNVRESSLRILLRMRSGEKLDREEQYQLYLGLVRLVSGIKGEDCNLVAQKREPAEENASGLFLHVVLNRLNQLVSYLSPELMEDMPIEAHLEKIGNVRRLIREIEQAQSGGRQARLALLATFLEWSGNFSDVEPAAEGPIMAANSCKKTRVA